MACRCCGRQDRPQQIARKAKRTRAAPLIWVDDRPANNAKEAQDLKDINLDVRQVTSTAEAIAVAGEGALAISHSLSVPRVGHPLA